MMGDVSPTLIIVSALMAFLLHIYSRCAREYQDGEKENQGLEIERQDAGMRDMS